MARAIVHQRLRTSKRERRILRRVARARSASRRDSDRAAIVLYRSDGHPVEEVAGLLGCSVKTVGKWEARFRTRRLAGLVELDRAGRPPIFTPQERHQVIALACTHPEECNRPFDTWSIRELTEVYNERYPERPMHRNTVWRILHLAELKPHKVQGWKHSEDPRFQERMRDLVDLYTHPPAGEEVVCVDEKTSIQALERLYPTRLPRPGRKGRHEFEYRRHGTRCLLAGFDVRTGKVFGKVTARRTQADFLALLDDLAARYPNGRVHVVLDNLNTHVSKAVAAWNERHDRRFVFHYTPTRGSWLNQIEVWFSILSRKALRYLSVRSKDELAARINSFMADWNRRHAHPFRWTTKGYPLQA